MGVYVYIKLGYGVTETQSYQRVSKFYKYGERNLGKGKVTSSFAKTPTAIKVMRRRRLKILGQSMDFINERQEHHDCWGHRVHGLIVQFP